MKAEIGPGHRSKTRAYFLMKVKKPCCFTASQSIFENKILGDTATLRFQIQRTQGEVPMPLAPILLACCCIPGVLGQHGRAGYQTEAGSKRKPV